MVKKPYGERRAQGIRDQCDTYRRLCEDFPTLHIWNNTTNRKHVDFEVTFPDGYVERIEHKAWAGHYRMTIQHYLDTRPKFKKKKGGTIHFIRPQEETADAKAAMDRDKRERTHGYGEPRNRVQNLVLSHPRPAAWSQNAIQRWHDRSFMRQPYGALGRRVPNRPIMRHGLWLSSTSPGRYRAGSLSGYNGLGDMDAHSGWDEIGELDTGTTYHSSDMRFLPPPDLLPHGWSDSYGGYWMGSDTPTCHIGIRKNEPCKTPYMEPNTDFLISTGGNFCWTHRCRYVRRKDDPSKGHWFRLPPPKQDSPAHIK